jgi:hypothetical protein
MILNRAIASRLARSNLSADDFEHDWPQSSSRVQSLPRAGVLTYAGTVEREHDSFQLNEFGAAR